MAHPIIQYREAHGNTIEWRYSPQLVAVKT